MRVLIGCEFSGIVRQAFRNRGHNAWSCDLLPAEDNSEYHFQCDVLEVVNEEWDLAIFHPPCTYLSNAGIRWFNEERYGDKARERKKKRLEAYEFVLSLMDCPIPKICIENPIGFLNSHLGKPSQIIHPYYFGDPHVKPTCLWLQNLPLLAYEKSEKPEPLGVTLRKPSKYYKGGEEKKHYFTQLEKTRGGHARSVTFQGIANAMANQWG